MNNLHEKHQAVVAAWKSRGGRTLNYRAPCCSGEIEDRAAPVGQVWDSLVSCPHCGDLYMKVTTATRITGELVCLP